MPWRVELKASVIDDLLWFGKKTGRKILEEAEHRLAADPLATTRNLKTLRPNPVAQRELRLFGKFRILFNVAEAEKLVTIVLAGEKRGETLIVQGEEFTDHHESDSPE
jgi:mRNA-degrading endonuclease RelE of RelBE toxin-antitoxin system